MSKKTVIKWANMPVNELNTDNRGWKKGKPRKYVNGEEKKVLAIYNDLKKNERAFFCGASAIELEWRKRYKGAIVPSYRFIGRTLKKHGLSEKIKRGRHKGASRYLLYPEYTILDKIAQNSLLEIDFVQRFIRGQTEPLYFLSFSLRGKRKLKHYRIVEAMTSEEVRRELLYFFERFEKPYAVKMDNDFAFAGAASKPRVVSKVSLFLMEKGVIPIFAVPRKPFSQGSVEGGNSVFGRKFWNRFEFEDEDEVGRRLDDFNDNYEEYLGYQKPRRVEENRHFKYCMYYIRKVYEDERTRKGYVQIGSEKIFVNRGYIGLFVLVEWDLEKEMLTVCLQRESKVGGKPAYNLARIKSISFPLTKAGANNMVTFYLSTNP